MPPSSENESPVSERWIPCGQLHGLGVVGCGYVMKRTVGHQASVNIAFAVLYLGFRPARVRNVTRVRTTATLRGLGASHAPSSPPFPSPPSSSASSEPGRLKIFQALLAT